MPPGKPDGIHYEIVADEATYARWMKRIADADLVCFDTETTSLDPMQAKIVGLSFAVAPGEACYIPLAHRYAGAPDQLDLARVLADLAPWFADASRAKIGQNVKYDQHVLANHGIVLAGIAHDTLLQSYVLESHKPHDMDNLAWRHLNWKTIAYADVAGKGASQIGFDQVPVQNAADYSGEDADVTLRLHHHFLPAIERDPKLAHVYRTLEMPVRDVLFRMERQGVLVDGTKLAAQGRELGERAMALEQQAYKAAGQPFNLSSPKQLGEILFTRMQLPVRKKTATGQPSTDEEVLQELAADYPLPKLLLEHRGLTKLKSTYTDKLPQMVNRETGRVHTTFAQATGLAIDHLRQLVGVGRLELGEATVLEQQLRQRVIGGELLQHLLVRRWLPGGGLLAHRQLHPGEQDLAELLGRRQVERLAGRLVRLLLERHCALAELAALRGELGTVHQHALPLHAKQHVAHRHFERAVDVRELGIALDRRQEMMVQAQRDVGILARIIGGVLHRHLVESDLRRTLAGDIRIRDRLPVEVPPREVVHVVRLVRLEHVRLQQRVVRDAGELDAVVGEHVLVVLDILPDLGARCIGEPRRQVGEHAREVELVGRAGVAMRERDVARVAGRHGERQPDDLRLHRVEARRFGVEAHEIGIGDTLHPARVGRLVGDDLVVDAFGLARRVGARFGDVEAAPAAVARREPGDFAGSIRIGGGGGARRVRRVAAQPAAELGTLVQRAQRIVRRRADRQLEVRLRQRAIGAHRQQRARLRQPLEAAAQVRTDDPADLVRVRDDVVQRAVLRQPLHRGFRADLIDARDIIDGIADQVLDYLTLVGDAVDNVPGIDK